MSRPTETETRYDFGRNWDSFAAQLSDEAIENAVTGLKKLTGPGSGARFLDIGSGSGVHSLAALRLGAKTVRCIDYDNDSVATTRALLTQRAPDADWEVRQGDILAERASDGPNNNASDDQFDTVYSWGVLHHTGDMWRAVENAATFVRPGGRFVIALYMKTPLCGFWKVEKYLYAKFPKLRPIFRWPFAALLLAGTSIRKRQSPRSIIGNYRQQRGMSFLHDVDDWLGGYPYESVRNEEVISFMASRGFELIECFNVKTPIGLFGSGCGEWVFRRSESAAQTELE